MSAYDWMAGALCAQVDPQIFFGSNGGDRVYDKALRVCAACPVRAQCEAHALRLEGDSCESLRHGAWGGQLPRERVKGDGVRQENETKIARDRAIVRLTEQGQSAAQIALTLGCAPRTVNRIRTQQKAGAR